MIILTNLIQNLFLFQTPKIKDGTKEEIYTLIRNKQEEKFKDFIEKSYKDNKIKVQNDIRLLFNNPTQINFESFNINSRESIFTQTSYNELQLKMENFDKDFLLPKKESEDLFKNITNEIQKSLNHLLKIHV
jgi:CRISPR/Cas system-associated protein Cas5 (RAMP superfamily)